MIPLISTKGGIILAIAVSTNSEIQSPVKPASDKESLSCAAFSKAEYKFVEYENKMQKKLVLPISLTYDHRVIDGAVGATFLQALRKHVEEPE